MQRDDMVGVMEMTEDMAPESVRLASMRRRPKDLTCPDGACAKVRASPAELTESGRKQSGVAVTNTPPPRATPPLSRFGPGRSLYGRPLRPSDDLCSRSVRPRSQWRPCRFIKVWLVEFWTG